MTKTSSIEQQQLLRLKEKRKNRQFVEQKTTSFRCGGDALIYFTILSLPRLSLTRFCLHLISFLQEGVLAPEDRIKNNPVRPLLQFFWARHLPWDSDLCCSTFFHCRASFLMSRTSYTTRWSDFKPTICGPISNATHQENE